MILTQYYTGCLSQAAYLIGDEQSRRAVIVDPLRDIEQYVTDAANRGLSIVGVILTHFHADFVAGHLELAAATGAWIALGDRARPEFDARLLGDGERIVLGDPSSGGADGVVVEVMTTPGHTPESISLLVFEHGSDSAPAGVLTGDALFVGDVGRVDLQASFGADPAQLAVMQHDTIQRKLMGLPDDVEVWPAHGAGSACGRSIGLERSSTIGAERRDNPACRPMAVDEFVDYLTAGQAVPPAYFEEDAGLNRRRHPLFTAAAARRRLSLDELDAHLAAGGVVLDARHQDEFALGHLPGSLGVPLVGRFAETAGMFLDLGAPIVIVVSEPGTEVEAVSRLGRIGADSVVGIVDGVGVGALAAAGRLVPSLRASADEVDRMRDSAPAPFIIDVRSAVEYESGSVPGAMNIPLPQLARRIGEVPGDRPVVVYCQSGWRSSVAGSWLRGHGVPAIELAGGMDAWQRHLNDAVPA
ncbi:rhodanese-like domain-containing protein [Gryllotalpicola reticulitermitis]|uniref:Rhodanese-like domain-containing protein n=1 Tax=Gryllotalpicola reticulitermitis TaxID=1184153 RepID=A0ABV8Q4S5_9MICO